MLLPESRIPVGEKDRQRIGETYPMFHVANVRIWKSWCAYQIEKMEVGHLGARERHFEARIER